MAVENCNTQFDWCDKLVEAKGNYNRDECCNIAKNHLREIKGIDQNFLNKLLSTSNDKLKFKKYYFPDYYVQATVTYTWDVTTETYDQITTTHNTEKNTFSEYFYKSIYESCKPVKFVGRNDERFYKLSHVDDLDGDIYNDSCVYTSGQLSYDIKSYARRKSPSADAELCLNSWNATAVLVPIAVIGFEYNGTNYEFIVNMHNGYGYYHYLVLQKVADKAKQAKRLGFGVRVATILIGVGAWIYTAPKSLFSLIAASALLIFLGIKVFSIDYKKDYFLDLFGKKGEDFNIFKAIQEALIALLLAIGGAILLVIFFV